MASEVKSAPEATEIARNFIKKYRTLATPLRAVRAGDAWLVEIDVGPIFKSVAKVKIDSKTGEVLEYTIP